MEWQPQDLRCVTPSRRTTASGRPGPQRPGRLTQTILKHAFLLLLLKLVVPTTEP